MFNFRLNYGLSGDSDGKESTCNAGDLGGEDPLEKEMATHSSVFAWKIPRTEEPSGLQSMGLQRVGHDRVTEHAQDRKENSTVKLSQ